MKKEQVVILGGGGIASIASWIMDRRGDAETIGLINDMVEIGSEIGTKKKFKVIGNSESVSDLINHTEYKFFVAFHGMQREQEVYKKICGFHIPTERLYSPIDPSAVVAFDYSEIGPGVMIGPLAQVGPDVVIGKNTVILGNAFVGHDSKIGEFCHIATNAIVGALIEIGNACHIGMNSTIREKTKIGNYCLVGMGAVVLKNIEDNTIVVGNPAKTLRVKE